MQLLFREVRPDEVEQELTQRDQFNTDRVPLAATLIRESLQNSMDARVSHKAVVRVLISESPVNPQNKEFWQASLGKLQGHLKACDIDRPKLGLDHPNFLLIEDFGTSGLTGNHEERGYDNFSDFWRRVGRSHKDGKKGGSWGLGKLVFPVSSQIRTFFGYTRRVGDKRGLLMGQTVLATHRLNGANFAPHGFFADRSSDGLQVPTRDHQLAARFCDAVGFKRSDEPGLSVAIPFPDDALTCAKLLPLVIENYFFPIITNELQVDMGGEEISAETFDTLMDKLPAEDRLDPSLVAFIREIDAASRAEPVFRLPDDWNTNKNGLEGTLGEAELAKLRSVYDSGALVHARVPISLKSKKKHESTEIRSDFDLYLKHAPDHVPEAALMPLFIRGSITVPNEGASFRSRRAFAAMVAPTVSSVSQFLRDAENPAHTSWNGNAEKLQKNWQAPARRLSDIRNSLRRLHELLDQGSYREDRDALKELISLKDPTQTKTRSKGTGPTTPPQIPKFEPSQRRYDIERRKGGFVIRGEKADKAPFPYQIRLQVAYDLPVGNPFTKFSPYDFDFRLQRDVKIERSGANCSAPEPNRLLIDAREAGFVVTVTGFDVNRDIVVGTSS